MLWKEIHEKYEKSLNDYAKQFREEEDDHDDFDFFVARESGINLQPKIKMKKTETIQTKGSIHYINIFRCHWSNQECGCYRRNETSLWKPSLQRPTP